MVGHQGVSGDADVALLGVLLDEVQEVLPESASVEKTDCLLLPRWVRWSQ